MDAANALHGHEAEATPSLSDRDREILEFERQWWKYAGAKETAVREKFDMSLDPLLPGAQRAHRPSRGARGRPAAGPPAAPPPGRPPAPALCPPPRLRALSRDPVARPGPARGGLPLARRDAQRPRRRHGRDRLRRDPGPGAHRARGRPPCPRPRRAGREPRRQPMPTDKPKKPEPVVKRGEVYVEVYNNSGITGLAGRRRRQGVRRRLAGRRRRQLVRHHPRLHRLLPAAAQGRRRRCSASTSASAGAAGGRPDAPRPAHRHPHRRRSPVVGPLPRPGPAAPGHGCPTGPRPWLAGAMEFTLPEAEDGTPRSSPRPRRPWSASTSTAPCRRSSTTRGRPTSTRRRGASCRAGRVGARGRGDHRAAGPPGARAGRPRRGRQRDRRGRQGAATSSASTATSAGPPPAAGGLAAAAARAGDVPRRELPAVLRRRRRRRGVRRGEGPGGRRAHPPAGRPRGGLRAAAAGARASSPSEHDLDRRARPQRDRGPLARHAQGAGRPDPGRRARGRRRSSSPATTSATSRRSRRCRPCAAEGCPTLLVCSLSDEESALLDLADVVVDGPRRRARPAAPARRDARPSRR